MKLYDLERFFSGGGPPQVSLEQKYLQQQGATEEQSAANH